MAFPLSARKLTFSQVLFDVTAVLFSHFAKHFVTCKHVVLFLRDAAAILKLKKRRSLIQKIDYLSNYILERLVNIASQTTDTIEILEGPKMLPC